MQNSSLKDFQIFKKLGEGAFGQVFQVKRKLDNQIYALKKVKMTGLKQKQRENAINQIRILASLNCQHVVKFKQAFFDAESGYLCIVMEYASGGDLLKMVDTHLKNRCRFKEGEIWKALYDIAKGLKSLHEKKILHRDLKSANIFVSENGTFKLGDLNVSKVLKKQLTHTQTGTPYYASPQVWNDLPYDSKSDIWSFGCILYEMAALSPPFKAHDLQGLYRKVKTGIFNPIPSVYSSQLSQFINSMLKLSAKDRPSAEEILKNPILKKHIGSLFEQKMPQTSRNDPLLNTIKFNPYNLRSLKQNLPKSAYEDEEGDHFTSRKKLLTEDIHNRNRTTSVRENRIKAQGSPSIQKKVVNDLGKMMSSKMHMENNHLPPISGRRGSKIGPSQRLQKIGMDVLQAPRHGNVRQRVHSNYQ